ncbi:MAG TPA: sigma 54-interacting transcriptional regulator [Kofleriaceae bacterium]|nr:sigma 54-interacting transcriptional regulator [Kofleriaceae bacterium]
MPDVTDTFISNVRRDPTRGSDWVLIAALDCERLSAPPWSVSLAGADTIELGRGGARAASVADGRMRIDVPDRRASQVHVRLVRDGEAWVVEDAGSKNGVRRNGEPIEPGGRARLGNGDVLEVGGTFLVLRRAASDAVSHEGPTGQADGLATMSPELARELGVLGKIARSRVPVLVRGDSGTGKEVVARAVHALSGRRGPLVPVNCGAIPATLLEGELFGSTRGAFSGAEDRTGLVRSAEHGTLVLDEVVELPAASQAALLRFLQDGEVTPLGSDTRITIDVRVVAATNKPIEQLIARGQFRRDLYARLCGHVVYLPTLHTRLEDLGLLVASLLARLEPSGPTRTLSRAAARMLFRHGWPLNVRELEQALRSALATATGAEIAAEDVRLLADDELAAATLEAPPPVTSHEGGVTRERMIELLTQHAGNLSAVARDLATSRTQVARLLARHSLSPDEFRRR